MGFDGARPGDVAPQVGGFAAQDLEVVAFCWGENKVVRYWMWVGLGMGWVDCWWLVTDCFFECLPCVQLEFGVGEVDDGFVNRGEGERCRFFDCFV